jgi:hypothetical protein
LITFKVKKEYKIRFIGRKIHFRATFSFFLPQSSQRFRNDRKGCIRNIGLCEPGDFIFANLAVIIFTFGKAFSFFDGFR